MHSLTLKLCWLILMVIPAGCSVKNLTQKKDAEDNRLIEGMFLKDIEIRELDARTDTVHLEDYDKIHRDKIFELLASNQVKTPMDKYRSALILQHTAGKMCEGQLTSVSPENFLLAFHLSSAALHDLKLKRNTTTAIKDNVTRMIALNYDRYLLFSYGYQKFGTQFVFDDNTGEMLLAPVDTLLSNDEERLRYHVEPLGKLLAKYKMKPLPNRN